MTFAQRRNRLTTYFLERVSVVKRRISVVMIAKPLYVHADPPLHSVLLRADLYSTLNVTKGNMVKENRRSFQR